MRITCVIGTLGGGGAERMMTYLCAGLASRGHQVTLLTLDDSVPDFYEVPALVTRARVHLPVFGTGGLVGSMARFVKLTRALRNTHPQVVISFMTLSVLASCLCLHVPYIYGDHLDVRYLSYSRRWVFLRNILLRLARAVTVLSQRDLLFIQQHHPHWRAHVIYNPALSLPDIALQRPAFLKPGVSYVLAVGRLTPQKGFDRLLDVWSQLGPARVGWRLAIIGGGEQESALKTQAEKLGISQTVDFVPPQREVFSAYKHVQIFVMTSRAEGFPLVLLEAMSAGLPVISFNCTGPDVIIRDRLDGLLVAQDDVPAFTRALAELMQNESSRHQLASRANEVIERFALENYINAYEDLCKNAVC